MIDPTKKKPDPNQVRIDHDQKLIHIPGRDEPLPYLAPITQRIDRDGTPYQHVASTTEMIEAEEKHQRCMRFVRNTMKRRWQCTQCGHVAIGTTLRPSSQLTQLLAEMLSGPHRVDWDSLVDNLHKHLLCPQVGCEAPCKPIPEKA